MILTIHDANLQKVAFIDNDKQTTLNYYDDTWTRNLETGSSSFEFTVYKKAIQSDTTRQQTYNYLNERAFVSFKYNGKSYVFSVMTVEEDEQTITCYCENLNLELNNEYANPYKATKAMSFVEYCTVMDLLNFTHLSIGINEISDQKRTLEWEEQDTKLARLLSIATKFDAEIDFDTELNADSTIKSFKVNVYHEYDDTHQGVGRVRNDITLNYGKNLNSIKRKIDKTGIYNAIRPTGKRTVKNSKGEEVEEVVTIGSLSAWSEKNADGIREFYQSGDMLYAPLSMQMYPSTFTSSTASDQWIRKDMEVDSDNPSVIRAAAIANLRRNAYPALSYEVDGFVDVEIGDTVKIYDDGFNPILLVQARVSEQKISFTNPASNSTTFANFKELKNNLSDGIQSALERLFEASKPYTIKLGTDNGVIFKNQTGQSVVTPTLYKGGKQVTAGVTWRWSFNDVVTVGMTYTVSGSAITSTATLKMSAYIDDDEVATSDLTFANVSDGAKGDSGTSVTVSKVEYQAGTSPTSAPTGAWSTSVVTAPAGQYLWTKTTYSDGKTAFTVAKQGEKGDTGTFDDDLSVENLLRGTKDMIKKGNTPKDDWYLEGAVLVDETVDGYPFTFKKWSSGAKTSPSIEMTVKSGVEYTFTAYIARENVGRLYFYLYDTWDYHITSATRRETIIQNVGPDIQRFKITFVPNRDGKIRPRFAMLSSEAGWFMAGGYKLNYGKVATDWSQAPEDIDKAIDSKADQVLTQTQLTQLQEANSLLENEIRARLTQQALLDWAEEYTKTVTASTDEAKAKAEDALKKSAERLVEVTQLGEKAQKWETTTGYIQADDNGLTIAKDGSDTKFIVTNDVISFVSGGKAVMTLTKGELKVDNGVFALSVRVGRFVEAPLESNPDINVIRYVGEVV